MTSLPPIRRLLLGGGRVDRRSTAIDYDLCLRLSGTTGPTTRNSACIESTADRCPNCANSLVQCESRRAIETLWTRGLVDTFRLECARAIHVHVGHEVAARDRAEPSTRRVDGFQLGALHSAARDAVRTRLLIEPELSRIIRGCGPAHRRQRCLARAAWSPRRVRAGAGRLWLWAGAALERRANTFDLDARIGGDLSTGSPISIDAFAP